MRLRIMVQYAFFFITITAGIRFAVAVSKLSRMDIPAPRPPSVEGFLPISALMSLKRFIFTGVYDTVHPAGLTILIAAIVLAVVAKKGFCSHICPVGLVSETVSSAGLKLKLPRPVAWTLMSVKYMLLGFFGWIILVRMPVSAIETFLAAPYNIVADAKMLDFFLTPSPTTIIVVGSLLTATLLVKNPWCRFFCPYGALLGIIGLVSPARIKRNADSCSGCGKCTDACPAAIRVHEKSQVFTPECIGCGECVSSCPKKGVLTIGVFRTPRRLTTAVLAVFVGAWLVALATGHWHTSVTDREYARHLAIIDQLSH